MTPFPFVFGQIGSVNVSKLSHESDWDQTVVYNLCVSVSNTFGASSANVVRDKDEGVTALCHQCLVKPNLEAVAAA